MKVIIPVAGEGRRMRPHTHTKPKPLLPVAGKPVIDHIMDKILPLKPTEIIFVTGHLKHRLEQHLRAVYPKVKMRFVEQEELIGTAGAVNLARDAFDEDVLIDFGDTIFDTDLSVIRKCKEDAIIWAMHREDYQNFGVLVSGPDGNVTQIIEKPLQPISKLASIGLYYFKNTKLLAEGIDYSLQNKKPGREAYLTDAIEYMIRHGAKIKPLSVKGWYDTGMPEVLLQSNQQLLEQLPQKYKAHPDVVIIAPVAIHPTAMLDHSTIGPFVSIGAHVVVSNSIIRNSILDEKAQVQDSQLTDSVLGVEAVVIGNASKVTIGDHSRVEGLSVPEAIMHAAVHRKKPMPKKVKRK